MQDACNPGAPERLAQREEQLLALSRTLVRWLDERYLDPLLGLLLPGVGDLVSAALGLLLVGVAVRRRSSPIVIARMLGNLTIDALVGAVPLVGDVFDFAWRANRRNLSLLERADNAAPRLADWLWVLAAALLLLVSFCLPVLAGAWIYEQLAR